jgi:hypothetical protein
LRGGLSSSFSYVMAMIMRRTSGVNFESLQAIGSHPPGGHHATPRNLGDHLLRWRPQKEQG